MTDLYYKSITDKYGNIHSIDNIIVDYDIKDYGIKGIEHITEKIRSLKESGENLNYAEKLNLNASRKYSFAVNFIHLDDGISVFVGKQKIKDLKTRHVEILPVVRLKVNLNKHHDKTVLKRLVELLGRASDDVPTLNKYDYAIDIPNVNIRDVEVFGTRKEKGLFKGTRYYGQRGKDGFCKIYNKAAEQGLDGELTRVEYTFSEVKHTKKMSFENIFIKSAGSDPEGKMTPTDKVLISLIELANANNLDVDEILNKLDGRKKRDILEKLSGTGYKRLEYDENIVKELVEKNMEFFRVEEFEKISEYENLPFT